jgi:superfamily I DNA/RNA helicase
VDKGVTLAVAGSGKTRTIINELSRDSRTLIITFTNNNYDNLRQRILEKFGEVPENISLYTYFSFLYTFCYLPCVYQAVGSRSINYNNEHATFPRKGVGATDPLFYQDYSGNLLGNRLASLVGNLALQDVIDRIERFYDALVIDEVQDFAANDFNLIKSLAGCNVRILYVGDYYQHTYDTSRDGNTQTNLFKNGYDAYKNAFGNQLTIDDTSLLTSYRCSATICEYVKSNLGIDIKSHDGRTSIIEVVDDQSAIEKIMDSDDIPKLFYQSHADYDCISTNWGASKGIDRFNDVCVVLNRTTWPMVKNNNFSGINESTKNKLYVAITRARGNVYFIEEASIANYKRSD